MKKAMVDGDRVIGFVSGDGIGVDLDLELQEAPAGRLFVVAGRVVDGAALSEFFIDEHGRKHIERRDATWPALGCKWSDAIVRRDGKWFVSEDETAKRIALYAAGVDSQ